VRQLGLDSGLAGKSEKPTCQRPGMTPRGVLRACKNATLRRICCGAIVEPRSGTYYRVISVRPMRGDSETSPGRPTEPGRGFFFASTHPFRRRGKCRGGFETAPTNGVRIRGGGSPKNATRFLGCPALPRPLSAFPAAHIRATQCVAPTKARKRRGGFQTRPYNLATGSSRLFLPASPRLS
jgi:hypothetical protein